MTTRRWAYILGGLVLLLLVIQLIPSAPADNPPLEQEVAVPEPVGRILERSCYDCHSHETEWPWYAHVAPMKWLVRHDVAEGREHLNFSAWNRYDADRRGRKWDEVAEEVGEGNMPLWYYLPLHREATLSDEERTILVEWAESQAAAGTEPEAGDGSPAAGR